MLRAISTLGCPELPLAEVFALAGRFEIEAVELRALGGSLDLPSYFAKHYATPARLAEVVKTSPVRVVALDTSFRLMGDGATDRDTLLAFVPWAEAAGVRWLRVFDGGISGSATELANAAANFRWWRDLRATHGWRVDWMVETHDSLITTDAILRFAAAVPGARILWDAHHTWRKGGELPLVTWAAISSHVVHVHVKDSIHHPSARHPFTYVRPGEGEFPALELFERLRVAFPGAVSLEWELLWHSYLPRLEEALEFAAQHRWW